MAEQEPSIVAKLKGGEAGSSVLKEIVAEWAWVGQEQAFSASQPLQRFARSTRELVAAAAATTRVRLNH